VEFCCPPTRIPAVPRHGADSGCRCSSRARSGWAAWVLPRVRTPARTQWNLSGAVARGCSLGGPVLLAKLTQGGPCRWRATRAPRRGEYVIAERSGSVSQGRPRRGDTSADVDGFDLGVAFVGDGSHSRARRELGIKIGYQIGPTAAEERRPGRLKPQLRQMPPAGTNPPDGLHSICKEDASGSAGCPRRQAGRSD
jgi:hypothetical protein